MTVASLAEENARLQALLAETQAALAESEEARRRLESIVSELRREKFDRKSEKLGPEQYNLPLEDVEVAQGIRYTAMVSTSRCHGRVFQQDRPSAPGSHAILRTGLPQRGMAAPSPNRSGTVGYAQKPCKRRS